MRSLTTLSVRGITKHYGNVHALTGIDLDLQLGDVVGLIGENGAGKSTLVGILSGSVRPDAGTVSLHGQPVTTGDPRRLAAAGIAVVVQEQALVENLTVAENFYLVELGRFRGRSGFLRRASLNEQAARHFEQMGIQNISPDDRVAELSFAQRQLVEIAKAFVAAERSGTPPVILLDEPTSALSRTDAQILFDLIENWKQASSFVYISHILSDVRAVADRIVILKDGAVVGELDKENATDAQLHSLMIGRERNADYYRTAQVPERRSQVPILELRAACAQPHFSDVNIECFPGEVLGLAGVVGSGASELAGAMAAAEPLSSGDVYLSGEAQADWTVRTAMSNGVLYVPPERSADAIFPHASVCHNIAIGFLDRLTTRSRLLSRSRERRTVGRLVDRARVKTPSLATPASELSGGNQQKLVFARWIDLAPRLMILNEPTRGIDVGSREEIYELIRQLTQQGTSIVLCSESLEELIGLSDRIAIFRKGRLTTVLAAPPSAKPTELDILPHLI